MVLVPRLAPFLVTPLLVRQNLTAETCITEYNQCGRGAFCLGGCDPLMSFSLDSCVPAPVCQDKKLKMNTLDRYQHISEYLGDPTKADWVGQGEPKIFKGNTLLTMGKGSVGTVLASTTYLWYGTMKARMKTSKDAGVVTAFILFSDVKDEIDWEWVGTDLSTAQTNFYFQGIPNCELGNWSLLASLCTNLWRSLRRKL